MSAPRILFVSTHGYVSSQPELGRPDTGGQVVYLLEMSKALARLGIEVDILTRQFENQPRCEIVAKGVRIVRVPYAGGRFIPKEELAQFVSEFIEAVSKEPNLLR